MKHINVNTARPTSIVVVNIIIVIPDPSGGGYCI